MDNVAGGGLAAQHLVQRGARHLAIIGGPSDMPAAQDRHAGWEEALAEAGVVPVARYEGDFTAQSAVSATQRLLVEHPEVDGLFVASDPMAIASLGVLRAAGRSVPGDVRVVGFDDTDAAREADLTTVTNPADVLTATATSMVLDLIAGDPVVAPVIVQPRLVRRHSS